MIQFTGCNIILDHQIKAFNGWVAEVDFLQQSGLERAWLAKSLIQKDINVLHAELGNPSEVITHATARAMYHHLTGMFKSCEDCALGKAKKDNVSKNFFEYSKILADINSPLTRKEILVIGH